MHRFSREQILCGLRTILEDEGLGTIVADEPFDLSEIEFFGEEVSWVFGVELTEADWFALRDLAERRHIRFRGVRFMYTLDTLAAFLVARVPAVSFEPMDIAGTHCEKAGAFLGLRDVARGVEGVSRFAPSTPIRMHLSRPQLLRLWKRIRWISRDALPPLKTRWSERAAMLFLFSLLAAFGSGFAAVAWGFVAALLHALSACKLTWVLWSLTERFENPLPEGIETFGDLARRLAEANAVRHV